MATFVERIVCKLMIIAAILGSTGHVQAEDRLAPEEADLLWGQGKKKYDQGDYAGALLDFQASDNLKTAPTTKQALARTLTQLGRLLEARDAAQQAQDFPAEKGEPPEYADARRKARKLLDQLAKRIPSLSLDIKGLNAEITVQVAVDGVPIPNHQIGFAVSIPINPGKHTITVHAAGYFPYRTDIDAQEKIDEILQIEMTELPWPPTSLEPPQAPGPLVVRQKEPAPPPVAKAIPSWAWVVGGAGVAMWTLTIVTAKDVADVRQAVTKNCSLDTTGRYTCPEASAEQMSLWKEQHNRDLGLMIGFGAAGTVSVAAAIWRISSTALANQPKSAVQLGAAPRISPSFTGVTFCGVF